MRFIVALLLALLSAPALAAIRYATPGGLTTGSCTITTPCTLNRLDDFTTSPGDIGYLLPGTYAEGINTSGSGTIDNVILFECTAAYPACVVNGFPPGVTDRYIQADNSYVRFSKIAVKAPPIDNTGTRYGFRSEHTTTGVEFIDGGCWSDRVFSPTNSTNQQHCIHARGTNVLIARNRIRDVQLGVLVGTDSGITTGSIEDNVFTKIDVGNEENADCIFVGSTKRDANYLLFIQRNDCSGYTDDGIDLYGGTNVIVQDNYIHDSGESTTSNAGLKVGGPGDVPRTGNIIRRNRVLVRGGGSQADFCLVANGLVNGVIELNIMQADVAASACAEINQFGISPFGGGTGNQVNSNYLDGKIGLYVRAEALGGTVAKNNILVGSVSDINVETGATVTGASNNLGGTGTKAGVGTYTTTSDVVGAPALAGGISAAAIEDFEPTNPALVGAGTYTGTKYDARGCLFQIPPTIGALEVCDDDNPTDTRRGR